MELEITCDACGHQHRVPLDASGHYSGTLPCDPTKHIELQVGSGEWRDIVSTLQQEVVH